LVLFYAPIRLENPSSRAPSRSPHFGTSLPRMMPQAYMIPLSAIHWMLPNSQIDGLDLFAEDS